MTCNSILLDLDLLLAMDCVVAFDGGDFVWFSDVESH